MQALDELSHLISYLVDLLTVCTTPIKFRTPHEKRSVLENFDEILFFALY